MSIPVNVPKEVTSGYCDIKVKDYQLSALSDTKLISPEMIIKGSYEDSNFTLSLPMDEPEFVGYVLQLCTYTKKVHFYQRVGIVVGSLVVIAVVCLLSL